MSRSLALLLSLAIFAGLAITAVIWSSAAGENRTPALSLVHGALFGIVLQRSRFCFLCHTRDFLEARDPRGVTAILLALAVGTLGYLVIFGAWLPDPTGGRLPPDAHIGPSGPVLALAAFVFGIGMAISGSCISGHLYRLGEGSPTAPFALIGTVLGFVVGFQTWNSLYVVSIAESPVIWLPAGMGYFGWLFVQLAALGIIALIIGKLSRTPQAQPETASLDPLAQAWRRIVIERWPATVGGAAVGVIGTVAYFQVQPLGVTAAIGSIARTLSSNVGVLPETLHGLDGFAGCRTAIAAGLSPNGAFVIALVIASFASALASTQFRPQWPTLDQALRGITGGALLGWGAMTAIGCTVGTLLSGTMAGAASGWIFLFASFAGTAIALRLRRVFAPAIVET
jgi:uncharacterized membrane protein YedE/YeeE